MNIVVLDTEESELNYYVVVLYTNIKTLFLDIDKTKQH